MSSTKRLGPGVGLVANRRQVLAGGGAALAAVAIGAPSAGPAWAQEVIELEFATAFGAQGLAPILEVMEEWNAANPGIQIRNNNVPWSDFWQIQASRAATGDLPDVWEFVPGYGSNFLYNDQLLAIDDYMDKSQIPDMNPTLIEYMTRNGKLHGLGFDFNGLGFGYNKALFAKAGISVPSDSWTLEDMKNAAIEVSAKLSSPGAKVWGWTYEGFGWGTEGLWRGFGATRCDDDGKVQIDNEGGRAMMTWLKEMYDAGAMDMPEVSEARSAWQTARTAMCCGSGWIFKAGGEALLDDMVIMTLPPGPNGQVSGVGLGGTYVISKNTKHPAEAVKFMEYLTRPDALRRTTFGGVPARTSAYDALSPYLQAFGKAIGTRKAMNVPPGTIEVFDVEKANLVEMLTGQKTIDEAAVAIHAEATLAYEKARGA
jgi:multiple sugar transport system substrate-binding protein